MENKSSRHEAHEDTKTTKRLWYKRSFRVLRAFVCFAACASGWVVAVHAQRGRGGAAQGPPATPRVAAPIDLTGYWVSLVTDDWRWRMVTPPKGDVLYLPVNAEGRRAAEAWDPAKDEAAGEQCRAYGAGGLMHLPGRLHIAWQNDRTLVVEADAGTQTRVLHFASVPDGSQAPTTPPAVPDGSQAPSWQGYSIAQWENDGAPAGRRGRAMNVKPVHGSLKTVTTRMKPGYFRRNGVPYSANAVLTEYWTTLSDEGAEYLVVTNILEDPQYLAQPYVRSVQFKKQSDNKGWKPTPCEAPRSDDVRR
jgi:hypothetical protein